MTRTAVLVVAALFPVVVTSDYWQFVFTQVGIYMLIAVGLNLLSGYGGQVSLGHGGLVAVGAYTTGILTVDHQWNFWLAMAAAMVVTAAFGVVMAVPAFRLSAWYFALVTLVFANVVQGLLVQLVGLTHGYTGIVGIPVPALAGHALGGRGFYWLVLVILVAAFLLVEHLVDSRYGRGLIAVREGGHAARASGGSMVTLKLIAFTVSAVLAGAAGSLYAAQKTVLTPDDFTIDLSIFLLVVIILGGAGHRWGPVVGALAFFAVPELLSSLAEWRFLIYGVALLILAVFAPQGITGAAAKAWRRLTGPIALPAPRAPAGASPASAGDSVSGAEVEVTGLTKSFGGVTALADVDLLVASGAVHAVVGPNGSGKTTLLNLLSGYYAPDQGFIGIGGRQVVGTSATSIARHGVGRSFQTPRLLPELSAVDNVLLGAYRREAAFGIEVVLRMPRARREKRTLTAEAADLLQFVGVSDLHLSAPAGDLPHGQQRLVEIARALIMRPRLLLLDEPAAGLSMSELDRLGALIRTIGQSGITVVIVEHHLDLIADICDRVTVLDQGTVLQSGAPEEVFSHPEVQLAYMGRGGQ